MMKPDGSWVCPICGLDENTPTCWHQASKHFGGCSTWYGGRLLHFSAEEVACIKKSRGNWAMEAEGEFRQLLGLGFADWSGAGKGRLTAEGENLCRHLWGIEP